jgi:hypothetical protein
MIFLVVIAMILVVGCLSAFVYGAILPGDLQENFRSTLRAGSVAAFGTVVFVLVALLVAIVISIGLLWYNELHPSRPTMTTEERPPQVVDTRKAELLDAYLDSAIKAEEQAEKRAEEERQRIEREELHRWRTWTIAGKQVEARFQKSALGVVYLQDRTRAKLSVRMADLSTEEQAWIKYARWKN